MIEITNNLPDLVGSEKQVAWATDIRAQFIALVEERIRISIANTTLTEAMPQSEQDACSSVINLILSQTSASRWIDNKNSGVTGWLKDGWRRNQPLLPRKEQFEVEDYLACMGL